MEIPPISSDTTIANDGVTEGVHAAARAEVAKFGAAFPNTPAFMVATQEAIFSMNRSKRASDSKSEALSD
jgi:hypothetical protein